MPRPQLLCISETLLGPLSLWLVYNYHPACNPVSYVNTPCIVPKSRAHLFQCCQKPHHQNVKGEFMPG